MAFSYFNRVTRALEGQEVDDVMLLYTKGEVRLGVIVSNNAGSGGADLLVKLTNDFDNDPTIVAADAHFKVKAGESVEINAGSSVAIWVNAVSAIDISAIELQG